MTPNPQMGALRHILYIRINKTYAKVAFLSPHLGVGGRKVKYKNL